MGGDHNLVSHPHAPAYLWRRGFDLRAAYTRLVEALAKMAHNVQMCMCRVADAKWSSYTKL